jgi:hypothetical protein
MSGLDQIPRGRHGASRPLGDSGLLNRIYEPLALATGGGNYLSVPRTKSPPLKTS